jgi:hypothetical protein
LEQSVSDLENVTTAVHKMGGKEFLWNGVEIGHVHWDGDLDILFTKKIRDVLVENGIVQIHKWVPDSGWTTFAVNDEQALETAKNLLLLSYYQKRKRKSESDDERNFFMDKIATLPFDPSVLKAAQA